MRSIGMMLAVVIVAAVAGATWQTPAAAQQWPSRSVSFIIPFPAGGSNDGLGRVIAKALSERFGQSFVVENKGGATGNIAAVGLARSAPDGYTLMLASNGPAIINKLLNKSLTYDPIKDFTPIIIIGIVPQVLIVSPNLPVKNLGELIQFAKSRSGKFNFGNSGYGTMAHIAAASLARSAGIDVTHVSYRGSAQLLTDVMGGQIEAGLPGFVPQVVGMKVLAVASSVRMDLLPDVPTIREAGQADLVAGTWFALVAPARIPVDIVQKVNSTIRDFIASAEGKSFLHGLGMQPISGTPADAAAFTAAEAAKWAPVIRDANIVVTE